MEIKLLLESSIDPPRRGLGLHESSLLTQVLKKYIIDEINFQIP